jgi:hypothetical protein
MVSVREVLRERYGPRPVKDCSQPATAEHHILYKAVHGRDIVRRLCEEHHAWITRRQAHAARKQRHELSEKQRWYFWFELIEGRMERPRVTHLDREYSSS